MEKVGRRRDEVWERVTPLEGVNRWKCNDCGEEFAGGASRIKAHLNKVKGTGIRPCTGEANSNNDIEHNLLHSQGQIQADDAEDQERTLDLQMMKRYAFECLRLEDKVIISPLSYLNQEEFITLKPETYLDSLVIDTFVEMLTDIERKKNTMPLNWYLPVTFSDAALNGKLSYFLNFVHCQKITENYMSDLESCDKIFIPVHVGARPNGHFYLYIIHLKNKEIEIWDSLPNTSEAEIEETTKKLLIAMEKLFEKVSFTEFHLKMADDILLQPNEFDCGVFVINYMQQSDNYVKRYSSFQFHSQKEREDLALKLLSNDLNKEKQNLYAKARRHYAQVEKQYGNKRLQVDPSKDDEDDDGLENGDSTRREESISQSIESIQQTLRSLEAKLGIQHKSPICQECRGPFHHPYHEPYHQPPFQPNHSPHPPYRSYHEPYLPPYNPYYEPSSNPPPYNHMPYHEPPLSFHHTSRPCQPPHKSLYPPFKPPYGPHSQPCVPNQESSIFEAIQEFQTQMDIHTKEQRSQMDSIIKKMKHQEKENERLEKEIEHLTQQSQVLKKNFQENPPPMFTHTQEAERLKKGNEKLEKAMEWLSQETCPPLPICNPTTQAKKVKKVRFLLPEESYSPMDEEQGVQAQKPHATSQVEDPNPLVSILTQAQEVKQVQKSIEEHSLPFGSSFVSNGENEDLQMMKRYVFECLRPEDGVLISPLSYLTQQDFITLKPETPLDSFFDSQKERKDLAVKLLSNDLNQEKQNLYDKARRHYAQVERQDENKRLRLDTSQEYLEDLEREQKDKYDDSDMRGNGHDDLENGSGSGSGSSSLLQNSGSEEDLQVLMDQRKRKRMISNRVSARRSRMRKQKHLDDLVAQLRKENQQILTTVNLTTQYYSNVESENSVLRAQASELRHSQDSLNEIIDFLNLNVSNNGAFAANLH